MGKTYHELLSEINGVHCRNSEFIEINRDLITMAGALTAHDYEIFWGCMDLYEIKGINYFRKYLLLQMKSYGNFSEGIEKWFENMGNTNPNSRSYLEDVVEAMEFFDLDDYQGLNRYEYQNALKNEQMLSFTARTNQITKDIEKGKITIQRKINEYFNFCDFSEAVFKMYVKKFTTSLEQHSMTIDEALVRANDNYPSTHIVIFFNNDKVKYIGKTEHPLSYIEKTHSSVGADSVLFDTVESDYIDDVIIAVMIFYDLLIPKNQLSISNRKYTTIRQACYAYRYAKSIPKKTIMAAIDKANIRVIDIGNGHEIIDKLTLNRYLQGNTTNAIM